MMKRKYIVDQKQIQVLYLKKYIYDIFDLARNVA